MRPRSHPTLKLSSTMVTKRLCMAVCALPILLSASCENGLVGIEAHEQGYIDTARNKVYEVTAQPAVFETAFFPGAWISIDSVSSPFYSIDMGRITIESSKLIACDPLAGTYNATPYTTEFPKGNFPVQLAIVKLVEGGHGGQLGQFDLRDPPDQRIAFSRILLSDAHVARWEYALKQGMKPLSLYDTSYYGYPVDAGLGCFADSITLALYNKSLEKAHKGSKRQPLTEEEAENETHASREAEKDPFWKAIESHSRYTFNYGIYRFDGHSMAGFSTGWGDGTYATYIGYDSAGHIARLLTDFNLVDWVKDSVSRDIKQYIWASPPPPGGKVGLSGVRGTPSNP